jgi:ectoine hydroxylase-related dioxygenase (phytanoyl-CoA dioxygenase family)
MTEQQRSEYEAQGYLVVPGLFDAGELEGFRAAFDRTGRDGGLDDLPNQETRFIGLAEHPRLFPVIHRIMGDNVQLRSLRGVAIAPRAAGRGWHRETGGILGVHHPLSTLSVQTFFHLDAVTNEEACLAVVPGSHRFKPDLPFPAITSIEEMPHHVPLRVPAGTAVVLNANLWQARTRNRDDAPVRLLEYTYIHCWMRQALPELATHAREVAAATHNLRQLFGLPGTERGADNYWNRTIEGYAPSAGLPDRRFAEYTVVGRSGENRRRVKE